MQLIVYMDGKHLNNLEMVYSDPSGRVQIFRCWDESKNKVVCLKEQACETIREFNTLLKEGLNQTSLYHPGICKLYECFLKQDGSQLKYAIVMEWMDRDLQREIDERAKSDNFWGENDLLEAMYILVDALAYAQEQDICHRDMKPQNIFINRHGSVKVGDFGSSMRDIDSDDSITISLAGTPLYLSPILRASFITMNAQRKNERPMHNPYKSDVYSLGISFLAMANLRTPNELATLDHLETKIEKVINDIAYSEVVKALLGLMLKVEENERVDFLQLREKFREYTGFAPPDEKLEHHSRKGIFKRCVFCNKRIILKVTEDLHIIQLPCDPRNHQFCSKSCFQNYVKSSTLDYRMDLSTVVCPKKKCKAPIDAAFIYSQYGGQEEMKSLMATCELTRTTSVDMIGRSPKQLEEPEIVDVQCTSITFNVNRCCHCFQAIDLAAYSDCLKANRTFKKRPIFLPCDPEQHMFCTKKCFKEFVKNATNEFRQNMDTVKCPVCGAVIHIDIIREAFGGRDRLQTLVDTARVEWMACKECKDNKIDVVLKCGHGYCKRCIRGWYEIYRIQGKRNWKCPICKQPMHSDSSLQSLCLLL
jgi:serine/threonine protein kinase